MKRPATFTGFLGWLLLGLVTFGIYHAWWVYSRLEQHHDRDA